MTGDRTHAWRRVGGYRITYSKHEKVARSGILLRSEAELHFFELTVLVLITFIVGSDSSLRIPFFGLILVSGVKHRMVFSVKMEFSGNILFY